MVLCMVKLKIETMMDIIENMIDDNAIPLISADENTKYDCKQSCGKFYVFMIQTE